MTRRLGLLGSIALFTVMWVGCSSSDSSSGNTSQLPCGAPAGDWKYAVSCDSFFSTLVHMCIDYYASATVAEGIASGYRTVCTTTGGTVLPSTCPFQKTLGSCITTANSGSQEGILQRAYYYVDDGGVAGNVQSDCEKTGGTYVPPGGDAATSGSTGTSCTAGTNRDAGASSGGVAFSVETDLNGEPTLCTNFVGTVTAAELQSVLSIGAVTSACPVLSGACACPGTSGSGTFGTTPTYVYYTTKLVGTPSECSQPGCSSYKGS